MSFLPSAASEGECDEAKPQCGNCVKRKQQCPGYRDLLDAYFKDETSTISSSSRIPNRRRSSPDSAQESPSQVPETAEPLRPWSPLLALRKYEEGPAILLQPSRDVEYGSLCFFVSNYINTPRDPTTNIFVEHILPLYLSAPASSALSQAVTAVAIHVAQMWMPRFADSSASREAYLNAVSLVKTALQDSVESRTDDTLAAVYMLDFYDSLNRRFIDFVDTGTHQQGGVALLRHRGPSNFNTPLSQRLFLALRGRHINYCLEVGCRVQLDAELLDERPAILPSAKLDLLKAELTAVNILARDGPEMAGMSLVEFHQTVISRALSIGRKLDAWTKSLPESWRPVAVPASELHPSIQAAGLYNNMCDVYSSLAISHTHNTARSVHVGALRLIALCSNELECLGVDVDPELGAYIEKQIQEIADRFCASVPFHLGNRTTLTLPHEPMEYPHIPVELRKMAGYVDSFGTPVEMTMGDHARAAAAIGGLFLLTPLRGLMQAPYARFTASSPRPLLKKLRKGQAEWIQGQRQRVRKIYLWPSSMVSGPSTVVRAYKAERRILF
ncbi:hypothetical protein A1O3_01042 [Capronia epimyces CBS 606.96]|uniref:Zn(2)-C6 fungal-type domain-containing protein n=1 Tax=Capronia epimyces CBS 606.96 TaxID=1182542 RepID=W9YS57_9EURO|nr:uncharacterized protein A1O3_01042 [Capronia epimyces CBS 606.96]EXJ92490.1 hypothetical protein A1O3_01042 [Capronia epimyces CBS 606.96]